MRPAEIRLEFAGYELEETDLIGEQGICNGALIQCYRTPKKQSPKTATAQDDLWEMWRDPIAWEAKSTERAVHDEQHSGMSGQELLPNHEVNELVEIEIELTEQPTDGTIGESELDSWESHSGSSSD